MNNLITTIVSSSLIATLLTSIVNYFFKKSDYRNEYYKIVINKRLAAYEWLEYQIASLKTSVLDETDQKPYHQVFSLGPDIYFNFSQQSAITNSKNLWLNRKTYEKFSKFNNLINQISFEFDTTDNIDLINAGKKYYWEIAQFREELEEMTRKDIITLYDFSKLKGNSKQQSQIINVKPNRIKATFIE